MKNIYCLLIGALLLAATSCNDVLDATPDGRMTVDEIFKDPELTAAYFSTCFNKIPRRGTRGCYFFSNANIGMADEGWECADAATIGVATVYNGMASASSFHPDYQFDPGFDGGYWDKYFGQIRLLNQFLERIPTAAVNREEDRARWTAEAHVLRAFFNMELMRYYGAIPIVTTVYPLDYDYSQMYKSSFVDCAKQVISDCQIALKSDALPWRIISDTEQWRLTRAVAAAIQSQAALYAASPLNNGGENLWEWAYEINKESYDLLKQNGYELYTTLKDPSLFKSAYEEYFALPADLTPAPRDRETIWQGFDGEEQRFVNGVPVDDCYRAGVVPTQDIVDAYDMLETGKSILNLENPYKDETKLQPNYNSASGYDPQNPYEGRDPRFYASVFYNGCTRFTRDNEPVTIETFGGGNCERKEVGDPSDKYTRTGYYLKKKLHPHSTNLHGVDGGRTKYYRLGEVYLNLAEAAIEKGTPESIQEGMSLINEIRHRAGFSAAVDLSTASQGEARLYLRHERQVEFAFEEHRFYDVRRWCNEEEDIICEKYTTGVDVTKNADGTFSYKRIVLHSINGSPSKASYAAKYKRYPIPQGEASRMEAITGVKWQNPGW